MLIRCWVDIIVCCFSVSLIVHLALLSSLTFASSMNDALNGVAAVVRYNDYWLETISHHRSNLSHSQVEAAITSNEICPSARFAGLFGNLMKRYLSTKGCWCRVANAAIIALVDESAESVMDLLIRTFNAYVTLEGSRSPHMPKDAVPVSPRTTSPDLIVEAIASQIKDCVRCSTS